MLAFFHGHHPLSPLHDGAPVPRGVKYVVRTDVMYRAPPGCATYRDGRCFSF